MTKELIAVELINLKLAYPNSYKNITEDEGIATINLWFEHFKDENPLNFKKAINNLISTLEFAPSIAQVKKELSVITIPELKINPSDEWDKVLYCIRTFGDRYEKWKDFINDKTWEVIEAMGLERLSKIETKDVVWARKQFLEMYQNKQDGISSNNLTDRIPYSETKMIDFDDNFEDEEHFLED